MRIYLSTWLTDRSLGDSMTKKRAINRLISYFFLVDQKIMKEELKEYYKKGRCDTRKNKEE
jgi:hypothetical protein